MRQDSCRAAARRFAIGDSTAILVMQHRRKTGSVLPPRQGRPPGGRKLAAYRSFLIAEVEKSPISRCRNWSTSLTRRMAFAFRHRPCRAFWWRKGTHIKKALMASERARAPVRLSRDVWIAKRQPRMRLEPRRLVFIDETSVNTKMVRLRGRCPRGERLHMDAPFGHPAHVFV